MKKKWYIGRFFRWVPPPFGTGTPFIKGGPPQVRLLELGEPYKIFLKGSCWYPMERLCPFSFEFFVVVVVVVLHNEWKLYLRVCV